MEGGLLWGLARRRVLLTVAALLSTAYVWSMLRRVFRLSFLPRPQPKNALYPNAPSPLQLTGLPAAEPITDPSQIAIAAVPAGDDHTHVVIPPLHLGRARVARAASTPSRPRALKRDTSVRSDSHAVSFDVSSPVVRPCTPTPPSPASTGRSSSSSVVSSASLSSPALGARAGPVVRDWDVAGVFDRAARFLRDDAFASVTFAMPDSEKLGFYGTYKQATVGRCTRAMPPLSDVVGRMKWHAWNRLGCMPSDNAKVHYVHQLARLRRVWETDPNLPNSPDKQRAVLHLTFLENLPVG